MTSNFYGLCFGLALFNYSPYWLYVSLRFSALSSKSRISNPLFPPSQFVAYPLVLLGLLVYFLVARPESIEMEVVARGNQAQREEESGRKKVVGDRVN
jgi:solute carrier family 35 protein F1/2